MGTKSNNQLNQKHIFDELNKTINSFTSSDDCSFRNENRKQKIKTKNKTVYKLKKHKKIINNNEMNEKIIESSLLISNFLINNIIDKKNMQRPIPDTDFINSILLFQDLSINEGFYFKNQKEFYDKLIYNGLNDYLKEYIENKDNEINKKAKNINKNINEKNYFVNQDIPVSFEKIFVNNELNKFQKFFLIILIYKYYNYNLNWLIKDNIVLTVSKKEIVIEIKQIILILKIIIFYIFQNE